MEKMGILQTYKSKLHHANAAENNKSIASTF
jgi:hypothetical protein